MRSDLTKPQLRELRRVRDEGTFKTRAGDNIRLMGLVEFKWRLRSGRTIRDHQVGEGWYDQMQGAKCIGVVLTKAGRLALKEAAV